LAFTARRTNLSLFEHSERQNAAKDGSIQLIRLAKPYLGPEEAAAASEVLASGMLVQGQRVSLFEKLVADRCHREHAVAVSSGTTALYLALKALGIGPGTQVLCPDLTWPSPAHAVVECGAEPVFVDVDLDEWNALPAAFAAARTAMTKAAIAIDQFGNPSRAIEIAGALPGIALIVDAACSLGSQIGSAQCGSFGEIACLSFHPRKVLTTGEGGMCLTDDPRIAQHLRELRNHGQSRSGVFEEPSGNFRLSEIAAAIGAVQMTRLDDLLARRRKLALLYQAMLPELGLRLQKSMHGAIPNYQTLGVLLPEGTGANQRDWVVQELRNNGVECSRLSYALHLTDSLKRFGPVRAMANGRTSPVSADIDSRGLALPLHPALTASEQTVVIHQLTKVLDSLAKR
jgi:perosamine synthetase